MRPLDNKDMPRENQGMLRENKQPKYSKKRLDFKAINRTALASLPSLLAQWFPSGKRVGAEWIARNPKRTDHHAGSFKINMHTGKWADFATGDRGGDIISLLAYLNGIQQIEAAKRLAEMVGVRHD